MDERLKYKSWHHKSPRGEYKQENLRYPIQHYIFTNTSPMARDIKERINKGDYIKLKSFCTAKETATKWKGNQLYGKTYLPMTPQTMVWSPKYIKNSHDSTPGRQTMQFLKWAKELNRHFYKEDIQRVHRHMKKCSASLAIRDIQIETTMRYHFIPVRMAIFTKKIINKCWRGCGRKGTLVHYLWECRLVQPLWKTVWNFLKKLEIELPFYPMIPLLWFRILNYQLKTTCASQCS